jgi:predicted ATPase
MKAFVLTGTPGSGKTAVLRQLERNGHAVVEEAATDVIALGQALGIPRPWELPGFPAQILDLQRTRRNTAEVYAESTVVFDRAPMCTLALCRYSDRPFPDDMRSEFERYERTVFMIRNQGFVEPTAARRISFADSLRFERVHEEVYRELGFTLVDVRPGPVPQRVSEIERLIRQPPGVPGRL